MIDARPPFWPAMTLALLTVFATPAFAADDGGGTVLRVSASKPARKTLVRRTEQPGQVEAFEHAPLLAKVSGYVGRLHVDIGDRVTGPRDAADGKPAQLGQPLVELLVPELDEQLRESRSRLAAAQAETARAAAAIKVAESAKTAAEAQAAEVVATRQRAEADQQRSQSALKRLVSLLENKAISQKAVDEARSQLQADQAAIAEADAKAASAKAVVAQKAAAIELAQADLTAAAAKADVAQAELQRAEVMLRYTTIRAPFDGVVAARNIDVGHLVQTGKGAGDTPLLVVVNAKTVRVFVEIPEGDAQFVGDGAEASIRVPSLGNQMFAGKVNRTAWALNPTTRTLRAEIDIPNQSGHLRPGMYVYADVKVATRADALCLPKTAVLAQDSLNSCFCVDADNKIVRKPIVVGIRSGDDVEVVSGLTGEENVILANASSYREGQRVEIRK